MLKTSVKIGTYLRMGALLLLFFCGYSIAQDEVPEYVLEPAAPAEAQSFVPEPPPPPVPPPPAPAVPLDDIPRGFGAQLQKAQPPAPEPEPVPEPAPVVPVSSSSVKVSSSSAVPFKFYEDYLDSVVVFARNILPGKQELETQKALIKEKGPEPKSGFETQAVYNARIANHEREKQKQIDALQKKYEAEQKVRKDKLNRAIHYKPDVQPNWEGILIQDTTIEGYNARIAKLADKISFMKTKTTGVMTTLTNLELLSESDLETLDRKNRIYMARLARAIELMEDYILQEYIKVLSTERKKFEMTLSAYDPEKEQYQIHVRDYYSRTVPFNFIGFIKVPPPVAQEINYKTDDFLASVDYINFPFVVNGANLYPGTKKADIYYKDKALPNTGVFQNVPGFENSPGYIEWAVRADSLISGKLKSKKLNTSYAMSDALPKEGTWWSRNKNIMGVLFLMAGAGSAVAGVLQNNLAEDNKKKAGEWYSGATQSVVNQDRTAYDYYSKGYDKSVKDVRFNENMRNGFYIGAGVFGAAAIFSWTF